MNGVGKIKNFWQNYSEIFRWGFTILADTDTFL